MAVTVKWLPVNKNPDTNNLDMINCWSEVAFFDPEPVFKDIVNNRPGQQSFLQCPAVSDFFENTFLIRSPVDLTLGINPYTKEWGSPNQGELFFKTMVLLRPWQSVNGPGMVMTFHTSYVFLADQDVLVETMPAFMHLCDSNKKVQFIPGTFNIHKWIRPVDFSGELLNPKEPLVIKRGDPLFYVRLTTPCKDVVNLSRVDNIDEIKKVHYAISAMTSVKLFNKGLRLPRLYKMAASFLKNKNWTKQCPFRFRRMK